MMSENVNGNLSNTITKENILKDTVQGSRREKKIMLKRGSQEFDSVVIFWLIKCPTKWRVLQTVSKACFYNDIAVGGQLQQL